MTSFFKFLRDDIGAVTIDWVALTAGILLLGIMVVYAIFNGGVAALVGNINETLMSVATDIDVGPAPNLNGGDSGGPMVLLDGTSVPVGSVINESEGFHTGFDLPDGSHIHSESGNGNIVPAGTIVSSASTLTLSDGSTVSSTDFFFF